MDLVRLVLVCVTMAGEAPVPAQDPPPPDPVGRKAAVREDAVPGYVELSSGEVRPGQVFLTREHRLKVYDDAQKRQREVPLEALQKLDAVVVKEWLEKEWRFRENANDEKVYTGRAYPVRELEYRLTLKDGRVLKGSLAGILYVQADGRPDPERFVLHKRDKGDVGTGLKDLVYVKSVRLGQAALQEGQKRAARGGK